MTIDTAIVVAFIGLFGTLVTVTLTYFLEEMKWKRRLEELKLEKEKEHRKAEERLREELLEGVRTFAKYSLTEQGEERLQEITIDDPDAVERIILESIIAERISNEIIDDDVRVKIRVHAEHVVAEIVAEIVADDIDNKRAERLWRDLLRLVSPDLICDFTYHHNVCDIYLDVSTADIIDAECFSDEIISFIKDFLADDPQQKSGAD